MSAIAQGEFGMLEADELDTILSEDVGIIGQKGSGKSFTARGFAEHLIGAGRRVVIIDPTDVWWGLRSGANGEATGGMPVVVFGGRRADVPIGKHAGPQLAELLAESSTSAVICTKLMLTGEQRQFVGDFVTRLYQKNRAPLWLFIDEAQTFAPQNPAPESRRVLGAVERLVKQGRVDGFRTVLITQRPASLNKNVLTQVATLIAMKLPGPQDRAAVREWVRHQADEGQWAEIERSLATLPKGEGWVWSTELDLLERVRFRMIRTFDSMRTPKPDEAPIADAALSPLDVGALAKALAAEEATDEGDVDELRRANKLLREQRDAAIAEQIRLQDRIRTMVTDEQAVRRQAARETVRWLRHHADLLEQDAGGPEGGGAGAPAGEAEASGPQPPLPVNVPPRTGDPGPRGGNGKMAAAGAPVETRIIEALANLEAIGVRPAPRVIVAALAGYKNPKSKGFADAIALLYNTEKISYPSPGRVSLTQSGRNIAPFVEEPLSIEGLHRRIFELLDETECRVLRQVMATYPQGQWRNAVAGKSGYSNVKSRGFTVAVARLRDLGFIEAHGGQLVATKLLYEGAPRQ